MGAVDGPGLRYVIFMQGCPLRCAYCHNPDTWDFKGGQQYEAEEIAKKVRKYQPYLKNGGVTITGGEPLMQPEFVAELFELLQQEGIHTALDTSGIGNMEKVEKVLDHTDLVLADMKFLSVDDYEKYCKADLEQVKQFLGVTRQKETPLWIRRVVVPGINDTWEDINTLVEFLKEYPNVEKVELLPFRKLCLEKYQNMGMEFPLRDTPEMDEKLVEELRGCLPEKWR